MEVTHETRPAGGPVPGPEPGGTAGTAQQDPGLASGSTSQEGAGGTMQQATEGAKAAVEQVKEKTQAVAGDQKEKVRQQIEQRSRQVGEQVTSQSQDLRSMGEELRKQGKEGPAKLADQVADRAERLGGYLQESDPQQLLHDIEDFGRRQPWAVVAGAALLGFAAARMLKASSQARYESRGIPAPARSNGASRPAGSPSLPPGGYEEGGHGSSAAGSPGIQPGGYTPPGR